MIGAVEQSLIGRYSNTVLCTGRPAKHWNIKYGLFPGQSLFVQAREKFECKSYIGDIKSDAANASSAKAKAENAL